MRSSHSFGLSERSIALLLLIEDGVCRFDHLQARSGIARNILTDFLKDFVHDGVLEKIPYSERPQRFEYHLSTKGYELMAIIHMYLDWLKKYGPDDGDDGLAGVPAIVG